MTEATTDPTTVDNAADTTNQDQSAAAGSEPTSNSEAARYRVQLREAEAARDGLTERLSGYQRRECEAVVADLLDVPGDLWEVGGADLTAFYNEDGTVNEDELRAAALALVEQRPRLAKPGRPHPQWGQNSAPPAPNASEPSWGDVIDGR